MRPNSQILPHWMNFITDLGLKSFIVSMNEVLNVESVDHFSVQTLCFCREQKVDFFMQESCYKLAKKCPMKQ